MSQDFGEGHVVHLRRGRRCQWCYEVMKAGERAYNFRGMLQGDWQNWYMHPECEAAYRTDNEYDDGFLPGDHARPTPNP